MAALKHPFGSRTRIAGAAVAALSLAWLAASCGGGGGGDSDDTDTATPTQISADTVKTAAADASSFVSLCNPSPTSAAAPRAGSSALVSRALGLGAGDLLPAIAKSTYGQVFFWDNFSTDPNHFVKQFVSGAFIAFVMTGLDQDLMQKNLACKNLREAQKNMFVFCIYMVLINIAFLMLGALLYMYAAQKSIALPKLSDELYPQIAFYHLDTAAGVFFILGLIASTYASSDSALTALTTSFCVDFLNFEKKTAGDDTEGLARRQKRTRMLVHLSFSAAFALIILFLHAYSDSAVIKLIFQIAGYTYGPLLGLYTFGLFTRRRVRDAWALAVCIAAPVLTWFVAAYAKKSFDVGFLTILINGVFTFTGLWLISLGLQEKEPSH